MSVQRPGPAQLRAIKAADQGRVSKLLGATGWLAPASVRPSTLNRVVEAGWIAVSEIKSVGMSRLCRYAATDAGREALDAARERASR